MNLRKVKLSDWLSIFAIVISILAILKDAIPSLISREDIQAQLSDVETEDGGRCEVLFLVNKGNVAAKDIRVNVGSRKNFRLFGTLESKGRKVGPDREKHEFVSLDLQQQTLVPQEFSVAEFCTDPGDSTPIVEWANGRSSKSLLKITDMRKNKSGAMSLLDRK